MYVLVLVYLVGLFIEVMSIYMFYDGRGMGCFKRWSYLYSIYAH